MQQYQFDRIYAQMEKEFGKIPNGCEGDHAMMLMPLESNVLKIHRKNPSANSRRLGEAIALVLFKIKERYTGECFNTDSFRSADNQCLEEALLMAFDPFTNDEVREILESEMDINDPEQLRSYYAEPIICLLRIKSSVDIWMKHNGSDGYFVFLEQTIGNEISGEKMNFSIQF